MNMLASCCGTPPWTTFFDCEGALPRLAGLPLLRGSLLLERDPEPSCVGYRGPAPRFLGEVDRAMMTVWNSVIPLNGDPNLAFSLSSACSSFSMVYGSWTSEYLCTPPKSFLLDLVYGSFRLRPAGLVLTILSHSESSLLWRPCVA